MRDEVVMRGRRVFMFNAGDKVIKRGIGQTIVLMLSRGRGRLGVCIEESVIRVSKNRLVGAESINTIAIVECAVIIKKVVD